MPESIYLDNNATTPVDQRVLEVMLPYFTHHYGNAASRTHRHGWIAAAAVETARTQVAALLQAEDQEIIFTSGATEASNLAIKGVFEAYAAKGKHIVTLETEHSAVLDTCRVLENKGAELSVLPVNREGLPDLQTLENSIRPDTVLVCIMHANNETGVLLPVDHIGGIIASKGSIFFCDATQAAGKVRVNPADAKIGLLALSAHKMYGPKGVGALYVSRKNPRVSLLPQMSGGGHERGLRSGTLNVPGIAGFGEACRLAKEELWDRADTLSRLRTRFEQNLTDLGSVYINGSVRDRLPNTTNLCFRGIKANDLIALLPDISFSSGSACSSEKAVPSHVLKAMHLSEKEVSASARFSLGKDNTIAEIDFAVNEISRIVKLLRKNNEDGKDNLV